MTDDLTKARDGAEMLRLVIDNAPLAAAETWQQAVVRLAALPPIEYDRVRIAEAAWLPTPKAAPRTEAEAAAAPTDAVPADAHSEGLAERTVKRAKRELGVVSAKAGGGMNGRWTWRLPDAIA